MMSRVVLLLLTAALAGTAGCKQEMADQAKLVPNGEARAFPEAMSNRPLPDGVVARGAVAWDDAATNAPPVTDALIARGRERYDVFCATCHGRTGSGDGMIVQRGFPKPVSFHADVYLAAPPSRIVGAIAHGYGTMYSFASRVSPTDRWAIAAYIRALQLSQSAQLAARDAGGQGRAR